MDLSTTDPDALARALGAIAIEAGRLLQRFHAEGVSHSLKDDGTPSTPADMEAERLILARLAASWPGIPVIAEETTGTLPCGAAFFLVDPLDGTSDFMRGGQEYSVNIAFVSAERPVAAALAAPGLGRIWIAGAAAHEAAIPPDGGPAAYRPARSRGMPHEGLTALVSRRHGDPAEDACLARLPVAGTRTASSAVKFGLIASGEADLYVRCGPTMEWDTAAGDHIVTRAGGGVIGPNGVPIRYGREDRLYRNGPFAAFGDPAVASRIMLPS